MKKKTTWEILMMNILTTLFPKTIANIQEEAMYIYKNVELKGASATAIALYKQAGLHKSKYKITYNKDLFNKKD